MKSFLYVLIVFLFVGYSDMMAQSDAENTVSEAADTANDTVKVKPKLKFSGSPSLTLTQTSFSNWSAGGANSIAGVAMVGIKMTYIETNYTWETTLDMAYGLTYQEKNFLKNNDKIDIFTKFGLRSSKKWYYSLALQLKTQFDRGYKTYPPPDKSKYNSRFMSPGYLIASLGMDYKPTDELSFMLSPFSAKYTFVLDTMLSNRGDFGVDPGHRTMAEIGSLIKATYSKTFKSKSTINSSLELFSSWMHSLGNIDISWEFDWNVKITKWFSTRIYAKLLYDDDIKIKDTTTGEILGPRLQFKQMIGVGVSLSF
ncbi:MAG: DUF3078 domain-containing protein [Prevotellaceae bacterium]|jgi:hypothetical protein|nr:DUF3078 domain-containing protein [Prevotellaceae bacterium]